MKTILFYLPILLLIGVAHSVISPDEQRSLESMLVEAYNAKKSDSLGVKRWKWARSIITSQHNLCDTAWKSLHPHQLYVTMKFNTEVFDNYYEIEFQQVTHSNITADVVYCQLKSDQHRKIVKNTAYPIAITEYYLTKGNTSNSMFILSKDKQAESGMILHVMTKVRY